MILLIQSAHAITARVKISRKCHANLSLVSQLKLNAASHFNRIGTKTTRVLRVYAWFLSYSIKITENTNNRLLYKFGPLPISVVFLSQFRLIVPSINFFTFTTARASSPYLRTNCVLFVIAARALPPESVAPDNMCLVLRAGSMSHARRELFV